MSRLRGNIQLEDDEEWEGADEDSVEEPPNRVGTATEREPHLPERGICDKSKAILISRLNQHNGLSSINRKTRLLDIICDSKKEWLGSKDSELRKRVRVIVSHWKRNDPLYQGAKKAAAKVLLTAEDLAEDPPEAVEDNDPTTTPATVPAKDATTRSRTSRTTNTTATASMNTPPRSSRSSNLGSPGATMMSPRTAVARKSPFVFVFHFPASSNTHFFLYATVPTEEHYQFSLTTEDQLGDFIVLPFADEEVDKQYVNGIAIVRPGTTIDELKDGSLSCYLVNPRLLKLTSTAVNTPFKKHVKKGWLPVLDKFCTKFKATKFRGVLKSYVARAKKRKPKVTWLELTDDADLSMEYFSVGTEGNVEFFPIPFDWEHETFSKKLNKTIKYHHSESLIVWRLSIVGSNRAMDDDDVVADDGFADEVADMLAGM